LVSDICLVIAFTSLSNFAHKPPRFCKKTCAKTDSVPILGTWAAQKRTNLQRKRRFGAENLARLQHWRCAAAGMQTQAT